MFRSIKALDGYSILALDDRVGYARDFYFDDFSWIVRYLVVDTGEWLPGRKVLISPIAIQQASWDAQTLFLDLTREQIESSPDIDTQKPISRQQEANLFDHYHWPPYWREVTPLSAGKVGMQPEAYLRAVEAASVAEQQAPEAAEKAARAEQYGDPHLRSVAEVTGYHIQASDGDIGHVEDFIVDDELWVIRYMVIDTRNWLPGKKVLVSPHWIEQINWAESRVHVDLSRKAIKNSPEYDPNLPVNREYEVQLYDYYGRPRYWSS